MNKVSTFMNGTGSIALDDSVNGFLNFFIANKTNNGDWPLHCSVQGKLPLIVIKSTGMDLGKRQEARGKKQIYTVDCNMGCTSR